MSFDLEILVEGRKRLKPSVIENIRIEVNSQSGGRHCYESTFTYMTERRGSWCSLFEIDLNERCFSAYNIADIKRMPKSEIDYPFWADDRSGMYVLNIRSEYEHSFKNVMIHLQMASPKKRIMFLPRLQGGEHNTVCGVITLNRFFELLDNDKILFSITVLK
ncbi:MAG: hypothetical protein K2K14_02600, partial [Ruminococcus sp.]|nr:hypothetical protein [Ruminococcus sp.]